MQELVFLVVLMVMTALGVRTLLAQLDGRRPALPRLSLPKLRLPSLPGRGSKRRASRPARHASLARYEDDDDAGQFAPARSPFRMTAPSPPVYEDEEDEEEYEDYEAESDYALVHRTDFFADTPRPIARATPRPRPVRAAEADAAYEEAPDLLEGEEEAELEPEPAPESESEALAEPAAELDPNDIMSFFDKPNAVTQVPETLREAVEPISAQELLSEARQVGALLKGNRRAA